MPLPETELDCQLCGACCVNPSENVREGYVAYVAVEPGDPLLARRDLVRKLVVIDDHGQPHLRLDRDGRCLALSGRVGGRVACRIYHHRPSPCRRVEAGSAACRRHREDAGLPWPGSVRRGGPAALAKP